MKNKSILILVLLLGLFYSVTFTVQLTQAAPIYYKLHYDGFDVNDNPHFLCQGCGLDFFDLKISTAKATLIGTRIDINVLVVFKCPKCGVEYHLFVALHKYPDGTMGLCIQKSIEEGVGGIKANWWNITTASVKP